MRIIVAVILWVFLFVVPGKSSGLEDLATGVSSPPYGSYELTLKTLIDDSPGKFTADLPPLYRQPEIWRAIQAKYGIQWRNALEKLLISQRTRTELAKILVEKKCKLYSDCSISQMAAYPLGAALRDFYNIYYPHSRPLDPLLVRYLSLIMPRAIAKSARWLVAPLPSLQVPGRMRTAATRNSNREILVVGNLIVLARHPSWLKDNEWKLLIAALRDVERNWYYGIVATDNILTFAEDYLEAHSAIDSDSEFWTITRFQELSKLCRAKC